MSLTKKHLSLKIIGIQIYI